MYLPVDFRFDGTAFFVVASAVLMAALLLRGPKSLYALVRIAAVVIMIWLVLEPTLAYVPSLSGKPALSVMVDFSRSMAIADPVERLEVAKRLVKQTDETLSRYFDLKYYQFSLNSLKTSVKEMGKESPRGSGTDIRGALQDVLREGKQKLAGILLISDGIQTVSEKSMPVNAEAPIFTVGVGDARSVRDIALKNLKASDFAFKGHSIEAAVTLQNSGFAGKTLPVFVKEKVKDNERLVTMQNVTLDNTHGEQELVFRFVPSAVGPQEYRVEVPVQDGEIVRQNNAADFRVDVGREKIRVLYLCGQPSPEYAFIRQILKSDPSVELVSFVILRNPENVVPVPEEQLSLIPFPAHDIFVKTLPEFDLLIFENFSYTRFGILPSHLENIRQFVEENGGGFLMVGGENSFGLGGYPGTGIEKILPVTINPGAETVENGPMTLKVIEPQHSIFDLGLSLSETRDFWNGLPALNGYHRLAGARPGASILAVARESGSPAMVAWQRGKGRVLAMASLSTWQWSLDLAERGVPPGNYVQLWRQIVRWLTTTTDSKPVRIALSDNQFSTGKKSSVRVVVRSDSLRDPQNTSVQLNVSQFGGQAQNLPLINAGRFEYRADWTPSSEGSYTLSALVRSGSAKYEDQRTVQAESVDLESENPYPDEEFLKEIAQRSGGEYKRADDFSPNWLKEHIRATPNIPTEQTQKTLWTHPGWLAGLAALLLAEWALRRYRGEI